jgi:hypothetical protein
MNREDFEEWLLTKGFRLLYKYEHGMFRGSGKDIKTYSDKFWVGIETHPKMKSYSYPSNQVNAESLLKRILND